MKSLFEASSRLILLHSLFETLASSFYEHRETSRALQRENDNLNAKLGSAAL